MILSLIFFGLAAICNAVMDTLNHHFSRSVFKNLNSNYWNPAISWTFKKRWPMIYVSDAWHLFKSLMLLYLILAIINYKPGHDLINFFIYAVVWGVCFEATYKLLLLR